MPDDQAGGFSPASSFPHGTGRPAPPLNATAGSLATSAAPSTAEAITTPERLVVIFFLGSGCCTSASERVSTPFTTLKLVEGETPLW